MAGHSSLKTQLLHARYKLIPNTLAFQSLPPIVVHYERIRLSGAHINSPQYALECHDPVTTRSVAAQPHVARLHGRIQDRIPWQNRANVFFGARLRKAVLLGKAHKAALLGMRGTRVALVLTRELFRVASGQDLSGIAVHEDGADAEAIQPWRRLASLIDGLFHECSVVEWIDLWM
jgi:hypothetical protein